MNELAFFENAEGLSRMGRSVMCAASALVLLMGHPFASIRHLKKVLDLTDEEWADVYADLNFKGLMGCTDEDTIWIEGGHGFLCQAIGPVGRPSARDWEELRRATLEDYGHVCIYCGADDEPLAIDHVVALANGGSNHTSNLVPACKGCNSAKGAMEWGDWVPHMKRRRAAREARYVQRQA